MWIHTVALILIFVLVTTDQVGFQSMYLSFCFRVLSELMDYHNQLLFLAKGLDGIDTQDFYEFLKDPNGYSLLC